MKFRDVGCVNSKKIVKKSVLYISLKDCFSVCFQMEVLQTFREPNPDLAFLEAFRYEGENLMSFILSTSMANQYIMHVIQERNNEGGQYAMTEEIIVTDDTDEKVNMACDLLSAKYITLVKEFPDLEGIYTVMVTQPSSEKEVGAHQNWFFYDVKEHILLRFEPNGPDFDRLFQGYRFQDIINCVGNEIGATTKLADNRAINHFNGCRATSTILLLLHMMGIDLNRLNETDRDFYQPLALAVSASVKQSTCKLPPVPRKGRRKGGKELISYVEPKKPAIVLDLSNTTVRELKAYLTSQGIIFPSTAKKAQLIEIVQDNLSMSPNSNNSNDRDDTIVVGDEVIDIVDFGKMTTHELRTYLGEEVSHTLTKPELLKMAINAQLTAIII